MAKIVMRNPHTDGTGEVDADQLHQALSDGLVPQAGVEMFNPHTGGTGVVAPDMLAQAAQDGLVPVGSHAHQVATTGKLESLLRGAGQGASFGLLDEAQAAVRAPFGDGSLADNYRSARDSYREGDKVAQEANPWTYGGGMLAGGVASQFIPGLGQVGALKQGANLGQVLGAGAKIGALGGFGSSESDLTKGDIGGAAWDTTKGALTGATVAGGLRLGGQALSAAKGMVADGVEGAFDPNSQRLLALGAKTKQLGADELASRKANEAVEFMTKDGLFERAPGAALPPSRKDLLERLFSKQEDAADGIVDVFKQHGSLPIDSSDLAVVLQPELDAIAQNSNPLTAQAAEVAKNSILKKLEGVDDLNSLWDLKKTIGDWVGKGWNKDTPDAAMRVMKHANQRLNEVLLNETESAAQAVGGDIGNALRANNQRYAASSTLIDTLQKQMGADKWQALVAGTRWRDWVAGNMLGSAAAAATGEPGVYGAASALGAFGNAAFRSPQARLVRAQIGQQMHDMMASQAAQQGATPRTAQGIQSLVQRLLPSSQGMLPPETMQKLQQIAASTDASQTSSLIQSFITDTRNAAVVSMVSQQLAPSKFQSEVDGHVYSPQDKTLAAKEIAKQGYDSVTEAQKISQLNSTGKLDPSIFAPPPAPDYSNIVNDFNGRISAMGF